MSQGEKREAILEAALKRFTHFGVDKTTMNEIADDLSISKASLYYYFPDKLNLYAAILHKIIQNDESGIKELLEQKDAIKAIYIYLDKRTEFIIKYHNILEYLKTLKLSVPKELELIFNSARKRELNIIASILEKNKVSHSLNISDPKKTAELFFDCLEGLRFSIISHKVNFFPDKKQFHTLLKREKEFASIFLKGLSA